MGLIACWSIATIPACTSNRQASRIDSAASRFSEPQSAIDLAESVHAYADPIPPPIPEVNEWSTDQPFIELTQDEMVRIALSNSEVLRSLGARVLESPAAVPTRLDPQISANDPFFGPAAALSEFDARLAAGLSAQNNDRVFNNSVLGGNIQELTQDFAQFNSSITQRSTYGTLFDVRSVHQYDANNRLGNRFPSVWESQLELGVRHPLLRGGGRQFNMIAGPNATPGFNFSNGIWIAKLNTEISQVDFDIQLRDYFVQLYAAYWDLHQHYQTVEAIERAKNLSERIWMVTRVKKTTGLTGGEAYKEAQSRAVYHRYARDYQIAVGGIDQPGTGAPGLLISERMLRRLMGLPQDSGQRLRPIDSPVEPRFTFDLIDTIARGESQRAEIRRQEIVVQQQNLRLIAAKNFLLPQLDLIGRTRTRGFGDDLIGDRSPRFASAADDFFSLEHQEYEFGVEMGVSAGRRQAHAAVRHAGLKLRRDRQVLLEQRRTVGFEIENAVQSVQTSYLARESSQERLLAAQERLQSSWALFDAGKIQLEFLIDAADELLQAESQFALDQTRYTVALVQLSRATGSLLHDLGIHT